MRLVLSLSLLLATALLSACHSTPDHAGQFRSFPVTVDSTRLGARIQIGAVTLRTPADWVTDSTAAQSGGAVTSPARWVSTRANGWLQAMTVPGSIDFAAWAKEQVAGYRAAHRHASVGEEWLLIGKLRAVQLIGVDSLTVNFHVLVDAPAPVVLDYFVPQAVFSGEVRGVESSIGSLRRL